MLALGYPSAGSLAAVGAMAAVREVAGRYATVDTGATSARLLLAKNPAGWAEVFDMLMPAPGPVVVAINARTADGHDPSWLWDVSFERLAGRLVVLSKVIVTWWYVLPFSVPVGAATLVRPASV